MKQKKITPPAVPAKAAVAAPDPRQKRIRLICLLVAVALILGAAVTVTIVLVNKNKNFDFMSANLARYVKIDAYIYRGLPITVRLDAVTDTDVEESIAKVLVEHKNKTAENKGGSMKNIPITLGDVVSIYYRGYLKDAAGVETEPDGTCNFTGSAASLEIGSKSFVSGFESGLIGKIPGEYATLERRLATDLLHEGDIVSITYSCIYPATIVSDQTDTVTLLPENKDKIDALYGTGFYDYLLTSKPSSTADAKTFSITSDERGNGDAVYSTLKIGTAYQMHGTPLTVETYFPMDYRDADLAGKTVYFDVYFNHAQPGTIVYKTPELNAEFIRDTLKLTDEELNKYEGEDDVAKYRAMVRDQLQTQYEQSYTTALYDTVFNTLTERAQFRRLPSEPVDQEYLSIHASMYSQWQAYCNNYGNTYDFDTYASAMMGLSAKGDYQSLMREQAEKNVKEKLVFYYIARTSGIMLPEEQIAVVRDEIIGEYVTYYIESDTEGTYTRDKYDSDEAFAEAKESLRRQIIATYGGEEYFTESARYRAVMKIMAEELDVTLLGRGHEA